MKKPFLVLLLFVFSFPLLFSQDYKGRGRIIGYVLDEEGKPLEGVKIKLFSLRVQQGFELTTNAEGRWVASWIRGGGWHVDFEKPGYMPRKITIEIQEYGKNPDVTVNLEKAEGLLVTEELKAELTQGNQLFDEGKYDEALAVYSDILQKFPDAHIINMNIGHLYFKQEKYDEARRYYEKVLEKDPGNSEVILFIGNSYVNSGENEKALEWYGKIDFNKINDATVLYNIGTNYYNLSKFDEALKYYRKAVEIKPDFLDGLYQLGLTYLTLGHYQDAVSSFENYLKLDPDSDRAAQVRNFLDFLKKK